MFKRKNKGYGHHTFFLLQLFIPLLLVSASCCRLPSDDDNDICLIPNINNRDITFERGDSMIPQAAY